MIDISKAEKIDGWMRHDELIWLAEKASKARIIIEVGTYLGRGTRAMGDNLSANGVIYTIDPYLPYIDMESGSVIDTLDSGNTTRTRMLSNLQDLILDDSVRTFSSSVECVRALDDDESPDFVFIDGAHDFLSVMYDTQFWRRQVLKGIISGHDYHVFNGVDDAVHEVFGSVDNPVGSIWSVEVR